MLRMSAIAAVICTGLILSGCSTPQCSPQIVKVKQKCQFDEPTLPQLVNPKAACDRNDSACIEAVSAYNFVEVVKYAVSYKTAAGGCR